MIILIESQLILAIFARVDCTMLKRFVFSVFSTVTFRGTPCSSVSIRTSWGRGIFRTMILNRELKLSESKIFLNNSWASYAELSNLSPPLLVPALDLRASE